MDLTCKAVQVTLKYDEFIEEPIQTLADERRLVLIRNRERLVYCANVTTGVNSITWQLYAPALVGKADSSGVISSTVTLAVLVVENATQHEEKL